MDETRQRERLVAWLALATVVAFVSIKLLVVRELLPGAGALSLGSLMDVLRVAGILVLVDLFLPDRRLRPLIAVDLIATATFIALLVYVDFYGQLPSRESLVLVGQAGSVLESISTLLRPTYLLFIVDIILLAVWGLLRRPMPEPQPGGSVRRSPYPYQHRLVYLALIPIAIIAIVGDQAVAQMPRPLDAAGAVRTWGLAAYVTANLAIGDISVAGPARDFGDPAATQQEIERLLDGRDGERFADFERGSAKGKSLIIIQMEALQSAVIGAEVDGQEVTPNLNRLAARSWYFPNFVSQVGQGTTSDAEFIVNTSLYPPTAGAAALQFADRELPSLPRMLAARGYDTMTFHTNTAEYWNRTQLYPAIGFADYFDQAYFGTGDKISLGASDKVLFDKTLEELERRSASGRPFYAQIITLSSHYPFIGVPDTQRTLKLSAPYVGTRVGDYLTEVNYADRQLGAFVTELEKRGMLDDAVLVVYGDHFGIKDPAGEPAEAAAARALLGRDYTEVDLLNVPMLLRIPGQTEGKVVTDTVGQIDIMPTVADPLGIDLSTTPHFGRDAFVRTRPLLSAASFVRAGSYLDGTSLVVPSGVSGPGYSIGTSARSVSDVPANAGELSDRVREIRVMAEDYVRSLPKRAGFDPDAATVLPEATLNR